MRTRSGCLAAAVLCCGILLALPRPSGAATMSFYQSGKRPVGLDLHGSAIVGSRVYVFGGKKGTEWNKQSWSAELKSDGTLGPWRNEPDLPEYRTHIGQLAVTVNDRIYIVGGLVVASASLADRTITSAKYALWTTIDSEGKLTGWRASAPFPDKPISNGAATADEQHLYVTGGKLTNITDRVLVGDLGPDGSPINWRDTGRLPVPLWYHGAEILDGRLYIWGGRSVEDDKMLNDKVYCAPISTNGTVGQWVTLGSVPQPTFRSGSLGFNDYLVSVGGLYAGGVPTKNISFCQINNGMLSQWQTIESDLAGAMYVSITVDKPRSWVLASGGRFGQSDKEMGAKNVVDTVQLFRVPQPAQRRTVVSYAGSQPSGQASAGTAAATGASFLKLDDALRQAPTAGRKILVFCYSPETPSCRRLWTALAYDATFRTMASNFLIAAIDTAGPEISLCYRYQVFKVPSFVVLAPDGSLRGRLVGPNDTASVTTFLRQQ